jgi:NTE family protein
MNAREKSLRRMRLENKEKIVLPQGGIVLTLSGGGSKGAYSVGVIRHLIEDLKRDDFKIMYGTSTGALIALSLAAMKATGKIEHFHELVKIYSTITKPNVMKPCHTWAYSFGGVKGALLSSLIFGGKSIYDITPLVELIDSKINDIIWEQIIEMGEENHPNRCEVGFCTVSLQTGQAKIYSNVTHPDASILRNALFASTNQPMFMEPIDIEGDGNQYVDGGLQDFNPIEHVFKSPLYSKCSSVLAISNNHTTMAPHDPQIHRGIDSIITRSVEILTESVYGSDIKASQLYNVLLAIKDSMDDYDWKGLLNTLPYHVKKFAMEHLANKEYLPIYHVRPLSHSSIDALGFEQPDMENLVKLGYEEAKNNWFCEE